MGAGEAGGGKRGWWGQARRMGAASHRAKSRANSSIRYNEVGCGNFDQAHRFVTSSLI